MPALDSLKTLRSLAVDGKTYHYYSLPEAARTLGDLGKLPMSLKVLLENLLRWEDGSTVTGDDLKALAGWLRERRSDREMVRPWALRPATMPLAIRSSSSVSSTCMAVSLVKGIGV